MDRRLALSALLFAVANVIGDEKKDQTKLPKIVTVAKDAKTYDKSPRQPAATNEPVE